MGKPDIVVKADPYTMPAHHQDVWWRPTTDIGLTEPRWVKAVEIRPRTLKGRRIIHHAVAYLVQDDDPDSINQGIVTAVANNANRDDLIGRRAYFMEWAIGKGYDLYRPDTGKLLLPGSKLSWDIHVHAVGEEIRRQRRAGHLAVSERRGAEAPHVPDPVHRAQVTGVSGHRAEYHRAERRLHDPEAGSHPRELPAAHAPARQSDGGRSHPAGRDDAGHQLRRQLQLQLDDQLHLRRRCGAGAAEGHGHSRHRLARQHEGKQVQSQTPISGSATATGRSTRWPMRG